MATYQIKTDANQELGLKWAYDNYADKTVYKTQGEYLQFRVDSQVTNPMYADQQLAQSNSFDESFKTVPAANQPQARGQIEGVIRSNGGQVIPPHPIRPPNVPPYPPTGAMNVPTDEPKN